MTRKEKAIATALAEHLGRRGGALATDAGTVQLHPMTCPPEPNIFKVKGEEDGAWYVVTITVARRD